MSNLVIRFTDLDADQGLCRNLYWLRKRIWDRPVACPHRACPDRRSSAAFSF